MPRGWICSYDLNVMAHNYKSVVWPNLFVGARSSLLRSFLMYYPVKNHWKGGKQQHTWTEHEKLYWQLKETLQYAFSHPSGLHSNQFFKVELNRNGWGRKVGHEFISNVIRMASVGINLIKIIGVHPLYVILDKGWGHSMLAICSRMKRVWRWITSQLQKLFNLLTILRKCEGCYLLFD